MKTSLDMFLETQKLEYPIDIHEFIIHYYKWTRSNELKLVDNLVSVINSHLEAHGLACVGKKKQTLIVPLEFLVKPNTVPLNDHVL